MKIYLAYTGEYHCCSQLVGVYSTKKAAFKAARKAQFDGIMSDRALWEGVMKKTEINWYWSVQTRTLDSTK